MTYLKFKQDLLCDMFIKVLELAENDSIRSQIWDVFGEYDRYQQNQIASVLEQKCSWWPERPATYDRNTPFDPYHRHQSSKIHYLRQKKTNPKPPNPEPKVRVDAWATSDSEQQLSPPTYFNKTKVPTVDDFDPSPIDADSTTPMPSPATQNEPKKLMWRRVGINLPSYANNNPERKQGDLYS